MSEARENKDRGVGAALGLVEEGLSTYGATVLPWLCVMGALGSGYVYGPGVAILVLAAGTLLGAISLLWRSLRAAFGQTELTAEDALSLGAPSAEEEQKRAVLRAIKDLDFERGVGKISKEDYDVLMAQYRRKAKLLLRAIDERATPEREKVARIVAEHLENAGIDRS